MTKRGRKPGLHFHAGKALTLAEWSQVTSIPYKTLYARLSTGWSIAEVLAVPVLTRYRARLGASDVTLPKLFPIGSSAIDQGAGVPRDSNPFEGTGAGNSLQETPNITFRVEKETA